MSNNNNNPPIVELRRPLGAQNNRMCPLSQQKTTNRDIRTTSTNEGPDLGELKKLWRDIASSEARLNLMSELRKKILLKRIKKIRNLLN